MLTTGNLCCLCAVLLYLTAQFASAAAPSKYTVKLDISISDEALKNRVQSLLSRELRSLADVEISDDEPIFRLRIVGFRTENRSNIETGHAIAVVVTRDFPISKDQSEAVWQTLYSKQPEEYMVLRLYTDAPEKIDQTCKQIVADFDANQMDPTRNFVKALAAALVKQKQQK